MNLEKIKQFNFEHLFKKKGYAFFTNGDYNLNIIGIRNMSDGGVQDDIFNDIFVIIYKEGGEYKKIIIPGTTDPGLYYLKNQINKRGTAILKPGQYRGVWQIDYHQGKYLALCQRKPVIVYRDNNKDNILDFEEATSDYGFFGINFHKAGIDTTFIGRNSAGCQVIKRSADFYKVMELAEKGKKLYGNSFTYTLITESDLNV